MLRRMLEISRDATAWAAVRAVAATCGVILASHSLGIFTVLRSNRFCVAVSWFVWHFVSVFFTVLSPFGPYFSLGYEPACQVESRKRFIITNHHQSVD